MLSRLKIWGLYSLQTPPMSFPRQRESLLQIAPADKKIPAFAGMTQSSGGGNYIITHFRVPQEICYRFVTKQLICALVNINAGHGEGYDKQRETFSLSNSFLCILLRG